MDCYIVTGQQHILNVINIKLNFFKDSDAECHIFNCFSNAHTYYLNLLEEKTVFSNIYFHDINIDKIYKYPFDINSKNSKLKNRIKYAIRSFFPSVGKKDYINTCLYLKDYNNIFIAGDMQYLSVFLLYNINKKRNIYFYSDGLSDYVSCREKISKKQKLLSFFGFKTIKNNIKGLYYYSPSAMIHKTKIPTIELGNLPDYSLPILKRIFNYSDYADEMKTNRIIFATAPFDNKNEVPTILHDQMTFYAEQQIEVSEHLNKLFPNNFAIRKHPASKIEYGDKKIMKAKTLFEVEVLMNDVSSHVFISPFSSIAFLPKFIFDKEPYIIFLYKLMKIDVDKFMSISNETLSKFIFDNLTNRYSDSRKIIIPETYEELDNFLFEYKRKHDIGQ